MHGTKQHSRSFIQHVDIVWMYLHWRFLNGYWGKYLKCRKYVHGGQAQTYQDSSKPLWGLGWVLLHLSTSTSLCRSTGLAEDSLLSYNFLTLGTFIFICLFFDLFFHLFKYLLWFSHVFMLLFAAELMYSGLHCECYLPEMLLFHYCWKNVQF